MLAALGLLTVLALLALIMSGRMSPLVALIVVPIAGGARWAGSGSRSGRSSSTGLQQTAPVAAMFVFAILFFGVITDAGLLDPIIDRILRAVGTQPDADRRRHRRCSALLVHLDGSGAVTFLVDDSGDAAALRAAGDGQARARLRRVAGRRA